MENNKLNILQVNTLDVVGGAAKIAWNLFESYRNLHHTSYLAVGTKKVDNLSVFEIPKWHNQWQQFWFTCAQKTTPFIGKIKGAVRIKNLFLHLGWPQNIIEQLRGIEKFNFPGTKKLLELCPTKPHILHLHNLHGDYFDLRMLPRLSNQIPTVITLHDAWLLSGHCAHSFACDKWKTGCGNCPDLSISPAIPRDTTTYNWNRKKKIYQQSKLYVATPCQWLMDKVQQSILANGMVEGRVIPNGIDLTIFQPGNKTILRNKLHIPKNAFVMLFAGHTVKSNPWKDYNTLRQAIITLSQQNLPKQIIILCLGEQAPPEKINSIEMKFIPYQSDPTKVAEYFQLADLYIHPAKAETFPTVILEALACGTPVIATNVGGIPEQVITKENKQTGMLVPPQNAFELAQAIKQLITNESLCKLFAKNASDHAHQKFSLIQQTKNYLSWYDEILNKKAEQSYAQKTGFCSSGKLQSL